MRDMWKGIAIGSIGICVAICCIVAGPVAIPIAAFALFATIAIGD